MTVPKTTSANTTGDDMDERRDLEGLSALVTGATWLAAMGTRPPDSDKGAEEALRAAPFEKS